MVGCKKIWLLILSLSLLTSCQQEDRMNNRKNAENEEVEKILFQNEEGVSCYRIPALIKAANGDLIAAADQRISSCADLRSNDDINIVIRRSSDMGHTWKEKEVVVDFPLGQSASDPSLILDLTTEDLFLFYNFMDLQKEKDIYYFHVMKSSDHGITWSRPQDITQEIIPEEWKNDFMFITSGRGTDSNSGLLHTLVNLERGLFVFGSRDHGASWYLIPTAISPADESKIVEMRDTTWIVNSRVNALGYRVMHFSSDKGYSWKSRIDSSLVDPGCNAGFIHIEKSNNPLLLFSNPASKEDRINLTIKYSEDGGITWNKLKTIYSGSSAYSSMTILQNENIGILYERNNYKEMVFESVRGY